MGCHQKGEKPLPDTMLTQVYDATWRHYGTMYIILEWLSQTLVYLGNYYHKSPSVTLDDIF